MASIRLSPTRRSVPLSALGFPIWKAAIGGEARRRAVRIAVDDFYAPLSEIDAAGHFSGMVETAIDTVNLELGWLIEYLAPPWKRAQEYIREGTIDAFCTLRTAERETYVLFADQPLFTLDAGWAYFAADNPRADEIRRISSIEDLQRFAIALWRGAAWPNDLMGPGWTTTELTGMDLIDPMIRSHRIDLYIDAPEVLLSFQHKTGRPPLDKVRLDFLPGHLNKFTFGLRRSYENAALRVSEFDVAQRKVTASGALNQALASFRV